MQNDKPNPTPNDTASFTWLDTIQAELDHLTEFEPGNWRDVAPGEKVLGKLTHPRIRRLYMLFQTFHKQRDLLEVEQRYHPDPRTETLCSKLHDQESTLLKMFWNCVAEQFDAWNLNLGVRTGWVVVSMPDSQLNDVVTKLLRSL